MSHDCVIYDPNICPVRHVMAQVGDKWSILVLTGLKQARMRFSQLKRTIPDISQRMLTKTLRSLERDGLVLRTVTPTVPPRVDYELTDLGRSLVKMLEPVAQWSLENREAVAKARYAFDLKAQS